VSENEKKGATELGPMCHVEGCRSDARWIINITLRPFNRPVRIEVPVCERHEKPVAGRKLPVVGSEP
jgi:hypothetical protein